MPTRKTLIDGQIVVISRKMPTIELYRMGIPTVTIVNYIIYIIYYNKNTNE